MRSIYLIAAVVFFASCNTSNSSNEASQVPVNLPAPAAVNPTNQTNPGPTGDSMKVVDPLPASEVSDKLNPPHGQPGHLCEIPVGSPLPKSAAAAAPSNAPAPNPTITTLPAPVTIPAGNIKATQPAAAPANGSVKLNPPHGQPGHDCTVAVGAPLKN